MISRLFSARCTLISIYFLFSCPHALLAAPSPLRVLHRLQHLLPPAHSLLRCSGSRPPFVPRRKFLSRTRADRRGEVDLSTVTDDIGREWKLERINEAGAHASDPSRQLHGRALFVPAASARPRRDRSADHGTKSGRRAGADVTSRGLVSSRSSAIFMLLICWLSSISNASGRHLDAFSENRMIEIIFRCSVRVYVCSSDCIASVRKLQTLLLSSLSIPPHACSPLLLCASRELVADLGGDTSERARIG